MQFKKQNQQQPQRQTAKEVIAANVQALIEQLEAGKSEALTAYLTAMSRFHNYSFGNICCPPSGPGAMRLPCSRVFFRPPDGYSSLQMPIIAQPAADRHLRVEENSSHLPYLV